MAFFMSIVPLDCILSIKRVIHAITKRVPVPAAKAPNAAIEGTTSVSRLRASPTSPNMMKNEVRP